MDLLERSDVLEHLEALLQGAIKGEGRTVLIRGEAGIGKTSVMRAFTDRHRGDAHILWGGCDDLLTPQPLSPLWDMAFDDPALREVLRGPDRYAVFAHVLEMMSRALRPTVVVIEDIHWADEATLDLVKFLSRRVERTHGLLLLTYRDSEVPGDRPLLVALGDVGSSALERIVLQPLSRAAVSEMAVDAGGALDGLFEISGGNPFFLTELLATGAEKIPISVRDAVMARLSRLSAEARHLVDLVSVVPSRTELDLIKQILGPVQEAIAEAEKSGVIALDDAGLAFRHELARRAVESELPAVRKRELNQSVLRAIEDLGYDVARAAHHARLAGDIDSLVILVPIAARRAADLESHSEAVAHLRALEPHLDRLEGIAQAEHYDLWAYEEYLVNEIDRADELIELGITARMRLGDPTLLGQSLLIGSRISWVHNRRATAVERANQAATVLEPIGGEPLASAYSAISQLAMLASDEEQTIRYGEMAMAVAGPGPSQVRAHALNNIGAVKLISRYPDGLEELEESYSISVALGLTHDEIRAAVNIGWAAVYFRQLAEAKHWLDLAHELSVQREVLNFEAYALAELALIDEMSGDWTEAEDKVRHVIDHLSELGTASVVSNTLLGRLQARRGEPEAKSYLFRGWELALQTDEIQRLGPTGAALAEFAWLGGNVSAEVFPRLREVLATCLALDSPWIGGELAFWLHLRGELDQIPHQAPEPFRLAATGGWEEAAAFWESRGIPYDRAIALSLGSNEARIEALSIFDGLGAAAPAARLRAEMARAGVTGIPRGPNRTTRGNQFGLTPRQLEVLSRLADDLTNTEIADALFLSSRTVDHHVSAILGKLQAGSRAEAVATAHRAGIIGR